MLPLVPLLLTAIPIDVRPALAELERFGPTPRCEATERIVPLPDGQHAHRMVPVSPIPALAGRAMEIAPYLAHSSQVVVFRAATLLCFSQSDEAKAALGALETRLPCLDWVSRVAAGAGVGTGYRGPRSDDGCPRILDPAAPWYVQSGLPLLNHPPQADTQIQSDGASGLARRISAGDREGVHRALELCVAVKPEDRRDCLAAMTGVTSTAGVALLIQAYLEGWDLDLLSSEAALNPLWRKEWGRGVFAERILAPALTKTAAATHLTEAEAFVQAAGLLPEPLVAKAYHPYDGVLIQPGPLYYAIGRLARSPAAATVSAAPASLREMQQIGTATRGRDPFEADEESKRITRLVTSGDREGLRSVATQPNPGRTVGGYFHQCLACCYLISLGERGNVVDTLMRDASGPYFGLLEENAVRTEVSKLLKIVPESDPIRPGLEAIVTKLSAICQRNDCSKEAVR